MTKQLLIALLSASALLAAAPAQAKKDGSGPNVGGNSPSHMSEQGQANANNPLMGQEKGAARADQRKSDQGLAHDSDGQKKDKKAKKPKKDKKDK